MAWWASWIQMEVHANMGHAQVEDTMLSAGVA